MANFGHQKDFWQIPDHYWQFLTTQNGKVALKQKIEQLFFVASDNFSYLCIRNVSRFGKLFLEAKEKSFPKRKTFAK